jgi:predicted porin
MNRRLQFFFAVLFLLPCGGLRAQYRDAGLWLSANVRKMITRGLSVDLTGELRMNENMTEAGTLMTDIGLQYRFSKRFRAAISYRFTLKRRLDDTYSHWNSWYLDGYYREKINPVTLALRLRVQSKYAELNSSDKATVTNSHIRTKLTLKYDLKMKFEPYVYAETFFRFDVPASRSLDQMRFCAGIEYAFNRKHLVDLHYLICKEVNVSNPETDFVIGLDYCFTF